MPNADTGHASLFALIDQFVATHPKTRAFASLGFRNYLSCVQAVDGVVGNSSSGLTEVPSLRTGTINIGNRQHGRLKAESVIDCAPRRAAILTAIQRLYSPEFRAGLSHVRNPYGEGGATARILRVLREQPLNRLANKSFYNADMDPALRES